MGYSWTKLIKDEFGRKGAKRSFTLALILMMFAGVLAFILPAPVVAGTKTKLEGFDKTSGKWSTGNLDGWKELDWVPYRIEFSDLPEGASSYTFNVYHNNLLDDKVGFDRLGGFRVGDEDGNPVTGSVTVSGPFYETLGKWGDKDIYYTITVSFTTPSPRLSWYFYWQAHLAYGASGWPGSSLHAYADISGKVSINVPPTPVGSISGYKWNDLNRDGTWDPNEQGLSGWTIQLYSFDSFESAWIHLADENTDSTGRYTFALVAGNYRLYEVLNGNWTQTFPPSGYHEIVLSEGETKDNINFGNFLFPTITTRSATGITTTGATMNADFAIGSYGSVDVWFQYRVQGGDTWIETTPATYTSSGSHSDYATGLSPETTYEFRAVLQYDTEKIYGDVLTFTTLNIIPTVTTLTATGVTTAQATMNADFTVGSYGSVDVWFQYRVQGGDTWIETLPTTYTASGNHSNDVTDLSPDTTYEFRAALQYDTEKTYGDILTFTTLNVIPTVTTLAATGVTTTQATMNADFTVGIYDSVDFWFEYRVQGGDTWIETTPATYTASGSHSDDVTDLSPDTTYEFRAVLQYDKKKIYGDVLTFSTLNVIPTVTTLAATGVTTNQATMNADFTVGIYDSVDFWFEYRVQGGDTWIETTPTTYTSSGSHSDDAMGLSSDTTHEFRAVLQYNPAKINGDSLTFTTKAVQPPSAPNLKSPADGTITNDNTLTFKWTAGANADNYRLLVDNDADFSSPEKNVLLGAKDKTYTISAPGLADGNYSWKVIAINAYGEIESSTWTFVIDTIDPVEVTFDRRLSGDKVGQHKAPPISPVNIAITATVSSQVNNATLADYFPSDWTVTDANGGIVSVYDENYNKIEWDVGAVSGSVSRSYVVRSPQRTLPPTKYYFHSELTYSGGSAVSDDWMVIVADPVVPPSPTPPTPPTEPTSTSQIGPTSTSQIGPMSTSQIEPTSTPPVSLIEPTPAQPPLSFYMILSVAAVAVGFLTAYSMLAKPSRYYVMLKRLKQLALEPIVPRVGHIGLPLLVPPAGVAQIRTHRTRAKRKEEGIMSKEREEFRKFEDANRELRATERELHHMEENRWSFTKNMMKFGFASWIFGLSVFLFAITLMGTGIFGGAPVAWSSMLVGTPLLVGAPAAPLMMISVFTRKHDNKIKRLRHIRRGLVTEYQGAALQYVEQVAASA